MSGARIIIDGLWHCLCPSIDATTFTRAVSTPYHPRLSHHHCRPPRADTKKQTCGAARLLHTTPRDDRDHDLASLGQIPPKSTPEEPLAPLPAIDQENKPPSSSNPPNNTAANLASTKNVEKILKKTFPFELPADVTTRDVVEALRFTRDLQKPRWKTMTAKLVEHLLAKGVPPNTFIYETLLMAQSSLEGSANTVSSLLGEMRKKKIPWSSTAYHSALRALAIHPDYLVRADVLRQMKERWIEVTPTGNEHVALGLLRDGQYELALEKLEEMVTQRQRVQPWVFDTFIYVFGKLRFFDDALRIARHRLDTCHGVPVNIWYFLLDVCSKGQHHEATMYVWERTVPQGLVNPPDGVCLNVLNMAASYGDADLATEVLQLLVSRGTKLGQAHYEAVADAYCAQGNIEQAIEAFCIMHAARVEVTNASMGSLSQALSRDPTQIEAAILAMTTLREKHQIPIIVFNAVLNQLVKSDVPNAQDGYARALGLYRRIREFVNEGPNWETFRHLLWRCTNPEVSQFLAGEMVWFGIRQNRIIMELMFQVQVDHNGPTHRAKRYFYKIAPHYHKNIETGDIIKSRKWQHFMDLCVKLVRRLISEQDPEAWRILAFCEVNGLEEGTIKALREEVEGGKIVMKEEVQEEEDHGATGGR